MFKKIIKYFRRNKEELESDFTFVPHEPEITMEDLNKFLAVHGNDKAAKTLSIAGKYRPFNEAIKSETGKILLHDVMINMEILLDKIIDMKASNVELAEYRVLRRIINQWSKKIMIFDEIKKKIKEA